MTIYSKPGSSIEGRRIICQFKDDPRIIKTGKIGSAILKGNPAIAVISKIWKKPD